MTPGPEPHPLASIDMDLESVATSAASVADGAVAPLQAAGVYQLLGSLLAGRRVVEIGALLPDGSARLEQGGAAPTVVPASVTPPLLLEEGSVDAVLCLSGFPGGDLDGRSRWLVEIARVLSPEGLCVIRMQCAAGRAEPEELRALLRATFVRTEIVAEAPFVGVSFFVSGTDEMALGGDLQRLASSPSHELIFCGRETGSWPLTESLFIPLDGLRAELSRREAWQRAVDAERDELRETLLCLQEQVDRQGAALTAFRRHNARGLQQSSEREAALETLALEREQVEQRAQRAEKALTDLEVASRRREVEIVALESELARLHARQPGRADKPSAKTATQPTIPAAVKGNHKSKPPA
jgi:hypothetical protein